jgi:hypothetical protein
MHAPAAALEELTDWIGMASVALPDDLFEAGNFARPSEALTSWVASVTPEVGSTADLGRALPAIVGGLTELAGRSGVAATWVGELILGEYVRRGLAAAGSELAAPAADLGRPRFRCGVESPRAKGVRRWLLAPPGSSGAVVVLPGAERSRALLVDDLSSAAGIGLVGLDGLELFDLADGAAGGVVDPALTRDATDALVALGAVIDAAVDLGICIGFVGRIVEYVTVVGDDATSVETASAERLGEAYAVLGALSEGLGEVIAAGAAPAPRELRRRAREFRVFGREVEAGLLSDLFELAGARATSGRLGLDTPWRDFMARQAVHPADAVLPPTTEQEL